MGQKSFRKIATVIVYIDRSRLGCTSQPPWTLKLANTFHGGSESFWEKYREVYIYILCFPCGNPHINLIERFHTPIKAQLKIICWG